MNADLLARARHACFDKDGVLTDVHKYWDHNSRLRADILAAHYVLDEAETDVLLDRMGIDTASGRIKPGGPIGFKPRGAIINAVLGMLEEHGKEASAEEISGLFKDLDARQQADGDYRVELLPGVAPFLSILNKRGVTLSVFSSDRRENIENVLTSLHLAALFDAFVGGGCVEKSKPDPEGFLKACRDAGVFPGETVYFGDTVEDMRMAQMGGAMGAIGVGTGLTSVEELRTLTPYVCDRLDDLLDVQRP
jgi:HAD superfamily hydrolase (TIGR01509 family)